MTPARSRFVASRCRLAWISLIAFPFVGCFPRVPYPAPPIRPRPELPRPVRAGDHLWPVLLRRPRAPTVEPAPELARLPRVRHDHGQDGQDGIRHLSLI